MDAGKPLPVAGRSEWRAWLENCHATETEAWVHLFNKSSNLPGMRYEEAVEEAVCFGWVDGFFRRVDDDRRTQRFTPRRPRSNWSESNRDRVRRLSACGLMHEAGLAVLPDDLRAEIENMTR